MGAFFLILTHDSWERHPQPCLKKEAFSYEKWVFDALNQQNLEIQPRFWAASSFGILAILKKCAELAEITEPAKTGRFRESGKSHSKIGKKACLTAIQGYPII